MTREEVTKFMTDAKNVDDWNERCDLVKKTFNGYPDFWYEDIIATGMAGKISISTLY